MRKLKFYKEADNRWYIDLPDWTGSKAELEMVAGADTMLDLISEGTDEIHLSVSTSEFKNSDKLEFIEINTDIESGAFYKIDEFQGSTICHQIWLCDVTKFVFGDFPKNIFISVFDKNIVEV